MAEDSHVPPLPRRTPDDERHVPGGTPGWGSGLTHPLALPESLQQRIRAALDYADDEAPPPEHHAPQAAEAIAGQPASLPRRVPGANNGPEPPAHIARPAMLPSLAHPAPAEAPLALPAATLGAIAAAAGTPSSDIAAPPKAAAPAKAAVWPAPAVAAPAGPPLVPAQRSPAEQQPDRHEFRDGAGNGARPPATPMTRVAMWAHLAQAEAPTEPLPVIPAAGSGRVAEKTVSKKPQSPQPVPPKPVTPRSSPPQPAPLQAPVLPVGPAQLPERARRGRGFKVAVALSVVLTLAGLLAFLLRRPGSTVQAIAPTTRPTASAAPRTAAQVRVATAAWVASQVSRAKPISCDPVMCQALRADGVPAADLLVLKPGGGDPLRSGVIVVTPTVTKMVGTKFLTADAPAAIASFGSGSRQDSVRVIYPQGAAAYAAALRQDIAERKANEASLPDNPRVTAPPAVRQQLQGGQVDSRLLLALAQLASQSPLSIVAFGDRAPGASPGVPLRSADLAVTGDAAGRARQMAAFVYGLQDFYTSARIRVVRLANGQDVVQVAFPAPSPLGVLNQ